MALMHDPSQDEKPHLLIGIEAKGDIEQTIRDTGIVVGDTAPNGDVVDLMRVEPGDPGLSQYFLREVKPFYERSWGSKLRSFFGVGRA